MSNDISSNIPAEQKVFVFISSPKSNLKPIVYVTNRASHDIITHQDFPNPAVHQRKDMWFRKKDIEVPGQRKDQGTHLTFIFI